MRTTSFAPQTSSAPGGSRLADEAAARRFLPSALLEKVGRCAPTSERSADRTDNEREGGGQED